MALARAQGVANYSSAGTTGYIPELFSHVVIDEFYKKSFFEEITNTIFEGEIRSQGDKVTMQTLPDIEAEDYVVGQKIDYQIPDSASLTLEIDKALNFSFGMNATDVAQMHVKDSRERWAKHAQTKMKIKLDYNFLNDIYSDAHADNVGANAGAISSTYNLGGTGAPVTVSATNVVDKILECATVLDEQDAPDADRWFVMPNWMAVMLKKSDLQQAYLTGDDKSVLRTGYVGMIDRFKIFQSNNIAGVTDGASTCWNALFGHKYATTFATQMVETTFLEKLQDRYGSGFRSLVVYGYKVIKPEGLGVLYAVK